MKWTIKTLILLSIFLFFVQSLLAQKRRFNPKQRFHAGIITGLNLSQIDGDRYTGYNKLGVLAGLQGVAVLTRRMDVVTELTFSQKGSRIPYIGAVHQRNERILTLNYAEVPFLLRIDVLPPDSEQKNVELEIGFSFARLIGSRVDENLSQVRYPYSELEIDFRKNDLNALIGMHIEIFKDLNLGLRANMSLNKFYVNEEATPLDRFQILNGVLPPPSFFRNYLLTIYANYQIY